MLFHRRFIILLAIIAGIIIYQHYALLLQQSQKLYVISAAFPTSYSVGNPQDPPLSYVILGDSTVAGSGVSNLVDTLPYKIAAQLASQHHYVKVTNLARSGAKMYDVMNSQLPQLSSLSPNLITLNCGANDATHFTGLSDYRSQLSTILNNLQATGAPQIIVATAPDLTFAPALPPLYRSFVGWRAAQQNDILTNMANHAPFKIVDIYTDGKLETPGSYAADYFHPNAVGYQRWADLYTNLL